MISSKWTYFNAESGFLGLVYWLIFCLTHRGQVMHICVGKLTFIGSDNGLPSGRRQAIVWTNAGILLNGHFGTNLSEILITIHTFSFKKMLLKVAPAKWHPFCLGLNVLTNRTYWEAWSLCTWHLLSNLEVEDIGVWERESDLISHFIMDVLKYPCWDES